MGGRVAKRKKLKNPETEECLLVFGPSMGDEFKTRLKMGRHRLIAMGEVGLLGGRDVVHEEREADDKFSKGGPFRFR